MGVSGGGPHAAVCAALARDRVTAAAIVSGVGPLADPKAAEGMMRANRILTALARRRSRVVRLAVAVQVAIARRWPNRAVEFMTKQLPAPDVAVLSRPEVRAVFERDAAHSSRTTARAAAQDFELFATDWGFDLAAIKIAVHIWQGDADRNVPPQHARLMHDAITTSILHECPGEGHLMAFDHLQEIVNTLKPPKT
jgi:pimeloyl-ACP methyl ester carboxylesterase